uniref:ELKS/Rab6-interacting/CAST family member 1 n=1 Tax=Ascaris suum TaxID=6253 RepID=F1KTM5_ASCSU
MDACYPCSSRSGRTLTSSDRFAGSAFYGGAVGSAPVDVYNLKAGTGGGGSRVVQRNAPPLYDGYEVGTSGVGSTLGGVSTSGLYSTGLRSRSVGPASFVDNYCDAMDATASACPSQPRRVYPALQRQHRSFDGMELLGDYESNEWPSTLAPLNVSTATAASGAPSLGAGPLSNPTTSNAHFWKQSLNVAVPRNDGYCGVGDSQLSREYELLKREYESALQKLNSTMSSIKTFWSPELKRERQLRKEESAKVAALQRQISHGNISGPCASDFRIAELEGELENSQFELMKKDETIRRLVERQAVTAGTSAARLVDGGGAAGSRLAELETRCNQLESLVAIRDQQLRSFEQQLTQAPFTSSQRDSAKDRRIADLEEELARLRAHGVDAPRNFTDKSVTSHELHTLRMKMERSEMELAQKTSELAAAQTRLQAATEENADLRKHLGVLRDSTSAKEQHATLLQSDIEALRAKLETKNGQIEQKEKLCERLESELTLTRGQLADLRETNKSCEQRMSQLVARLDALESVLREKEQELEKTKQKLLAQPDVQMERHMQLQIDEANREKTRLQCLIDDLRRNAEKEKTQQLETFQEQNRQLTATIESLQKELSDRQILLESQNEKIGDLDRELCSAERQRKEQPSQQTNDEQVAEARKEIESLLRMVQTLEKEKSSLFSQCKQLQSTLEEVHKEGSLAATTTAHRTDTLTLSTNGTLKNRVEELEEALRESVSITAERELHVAQQKQLNQQLALQLSESRREVCELRKMVKELSSGDREEMLRSFEAERRKHLEQLLQLKHEALVAAIAEKDAHIALLEQSHERPRDEIETLRTHKEKLIEKLKQENERRAQLINSTAVNVAPGAPVQAPSSSAVSAFVPAAAMPMTIAAAPLPTASSTTDQEDDAEGIWA